MANSAKFEALYILNKSCHKEGEHIGKKLIFQCIWWCVGTAAHFWFEVCSQKNIFQLFFPKELQFNTIFEFCTKIWTKQPFCAVKIDVFGAFLATLRSNFSCKTVSSDIRKINLFCWNKVRDSNPKNYLTSQRARKFVFLRKWYLATLSIKTVAWCSSWLNSETRIFYVASTRLLNVS